MVQSNEIIMFPKDILLFRHYTVIKKHVKKLIIHNDHHSDPLKSQIFDLNTHWNHEIIIYHHISSYIIMYHHISSYIIIYHHKITIENPQNHNCSKVKAPLSRHGVAARRWFAVLPWQGRFGIGFPAAELHSASEESAKAKNSINNYI